MSRLKHGWLAALAALLLAGLPAAAQLQTGDLFGSVVGNDGQPLPGVTVTLEGSGSPRVQTTDTEGAFRFPGLYPGIYKLTAELQGFSTLEYPDIAIRIGGNTEIEVTMSGAVEDVITVTGESPLIDERQVNRGANVPAVELDKVPTARDPWSLLALAPGVLVDRFNLGGNESGQQSSFLGVGSSARDNTFAVDGVILTDMNAVGASATYFDFGAFEEVQFTVSSADVSVATAGVTINQVTKRGTNEWRGQARYLRTDGEVQSDAETLVRLDEGPGAADDILVTGNEIDAVEEYGLDIGGPLWQDHLWIWAAYGESDIGNVVGGGQLDTTQLEDFNAKLSFQAGPQNSGVLHYWTNDKLKSGRGAGPTREPGTTHDQTTPQDIYKIEDTWIPTSDFVLTGLWARDDGIFTLSPQAGLDGDRFLDESGVLHGTNYEFTQEAVIDQGRLDANYFFGAGPSNHQLKFGAGYREQENHSGTVWPRGRFVEAGENYDNPDTELVVFPRNRNVAMRSSYDSAWVQDTITLDRWTFNAGLRYDNQTLENLPSSDPGTPGIPGDLLPPIRFQGNDAGGFEWETVVPRVGATYALGDERKTLLRGTFSQYAEQLGQLPLATLVNPVGYAYAYFYFVDANHNLVLDPDEYGSLEFSDVYNINLDDPGSLSSPTTIDRDLGPIMTDEVTFGLEHALRGDLAVGVTLTWRNIRDIPESRLLVVDASGQTRQATRDDWELVDTITETLPDGRTSRPVDIYDLKEGIEPTGGSFITNGDREQSYLGATLSFTKRLANRWSMRGHATFADWEWDIGPEYRRYDDPTDVLTDDYGYPDSEEVYSERSGGNKADVFVGGRWSFNLSGLYQVAPERPWGFNLGGSVDGREGYINPPFARERSAAGNRNVQLADIDEFRHDDVMVVSAHADKDFTFGDVRFNLSLDGFNLTGEDVVLQRQRNARTSLGDTNPLFYYPTEALSPRVFRAGITVRFR